MKLRKGFVSNSSSSSFVCDFCGDTVSGYDMSLSKFDMSQCENGHIFCNGHADEQFEINTKEKAYDFLLNYFNRELKDDEHWLEKYQNENNTEYIESYSSYVKKDKDRIEKLKQDFDTLNDDEFDDEYSDYVHDIIMDYGVPEKYCPVCQRQKKMQEDEKYEQYKELFDHFGGIKPNGCI